MTFHTIDAHGKLPNLSVEVDFANDPTSVTRTWTDITTDVRQLNYTRSGRSDALQQTSTGTLTAVVNNRSGNYDPANAAGSHYPNVKRMRWIRVQAQWAGVTYNRWQGLITAWDQSWPSAGKDATVTIQAADALKVLSLFDLGGKDYAAQRTDQRVSAVCTDAGVPCSVSTGVSSIVDSGTISTGTSALSHLQSVEDTENGRLFADAGGTIVFHDRHYRLQHSSTSQGTIGDAAGEIPYRDNASLASDDANIYNQAVVTPSGGTAETASDSGSQTSFYARSVSRSLLTSSQTEALSAAEYLVKLYKDPAPKLPALALLPQKNTSLWPKVLGAANSQRFTFKRRPSYGTINVDGFVEQVADIIVPGASWDVAVQLAAVDDQSCWVLGDSTYGLLGRTTYVGY